MRTFGEVCMAHGRGKEPNKSFRGAAFAKGLAVWKLGWATTAAS